MSNVSNGVLFGLLLAVLAVAAVLVPNYFLDRPTARTASIALRLLIGVAVVYSVTRWQRSQKEKRSRPKEEE